MSVMSELHVVGFDKVDFGSFETAIIIPIVGVEYSLSYIRYSKD